MTAGAVTACVLCGRPATETVEPPRRTLPRVVAHAEPVASVTVILPVVALCPAHALEVRLGGRLVGWCDDLRCRSYGEAGELSPCGEPYLT